MRQLDTDTAWVGFVFKYLVLLLPKMGLLFAFLDSGEIMATKVFCKLHSLGNDIYPHLTASLP